MKKSRSWQYLGAFTVAITLSFFVDRVDAGPPATDLCEDAPTVGEGSFSFDYSAAGLDFAEPCLFNNIVDVWFLYTPSENGVATLDTCDSVVADDTGLAIYGTATCPPGSAPLACNEDAGCGPNGYLSQVSVPVSVGNTYLVRVSGFVGSAFGPGTLDIALSGGGPAPENDLCENAISVGEGCFAFDNSGATTDLAQACGDAAEGSDVWYDYTPSANGFATLTTCSSAGAIDDTVVSVYETDTCLPDPGADLLGCNDNAFCGATGFLSEVTVPVVQGNNYLVQVSSFVPGDGNLDIGLATGPPPLDLADLTAGVDFTRVLGPDNDNGGIFNLGVLGVAVAGGFDIDGDGFRDYAVAHMISSPMGRPAAGQVNLVFGDGTIDDEHDVQAGSPQVLRILGEGNLSGLGVLEMTGSEIWMGDVTGDGIGDLLICRQNYSIDNRIGAGALTIVVGDAKLRELAQAGEALDLANPPANVTLMHLVGPHTGARLGIWARIGDVDGDGTTDFVVAADQETVGANTHAGALYVVLGGDHLNSSETVDLANFGTTSLVGSIARVTPPTPASEFHFGATCQVGDLDGNGRAEVMAGAAINRAGASVSPLQGGPPFSHGGNTGLGPLGGRFFIVWDDAFPETPWPAGLRIDLGTLNGTVTTVRGGASNTSFGEEILGGLDYTGDGKAELFAGDIVGDSPNGNNSGLGYVFYQAELLKGLDFNVDNPPPGIEITTIWGPTAGAISSDTAGEGDFNGDGIGDLMVGSPETHSPGSPNARFQSGKIHVFFGQPGPWPELVDLAPKEIGAVGSDAVIKEIQGAVGAANDAGDTLCYSAMVGEIDGDGKMDIITNEMRGNGVNPAATDSGNLVVIPGALLVEPCGAATALSCASNGDDVDLSWNNGESYEEIRVLRNSQFIAILPGADTSFTDVAPGAGSYVYGIQGVCEGASIGLTTCSIDHNLLPDFIRGDGDGDGSFNGLVDGLHILRFQFQNGSPPPCMEAADADGDRTFNGLSDGLYVLEHQFQSGPPPSAPYPECGQDPNRENNLGCKTHPGCR